MKSEPSSRNPWGLARLLSGDPVAEISSSVDFRRNKLILSLVIMSAGMLLALVSTMVRGWMWGEGYPYDTFLSKPQIRFSDFTDASLYSSWTNPYVDPFAGYLPLAWSFFRALSTVPSPFGLTAFLFISLGGLFIFLVQVFASMGISPWRRVFVALLFLTLSYPVIAAVDRGNLEIFVALWVAAALFFFSRCRYGIGMLCLLPVMSFKMYPALFFLLLLRQRRIKLIACGLVIFFALFFISWNVLGVPAETAFPYYDRNLVFFTRFYVYENYGLEGCASLWNAYKVCLITGAHLGFIPPVDFSFDGRFIKLSYAIYSSSAALLAVGLAFYVCLVEKEFLRCAIALQLYLSAVTPFGADYRLLYANIALVIFILIETKRPHDWLILILLALVMVPKKEVFFTYAGLSENGSPDVSIQVLLNPLLVFGALLLLLYDSWTSFDLRWTRLRSGRLIRALLP